MCRVCVLGLVLLLSFLNDANAASIDCAQCAAWNKDQVPFRIFGNTYYVGTRGLSSVLITSAMGHVLIDGALPQSAALITRHVEQLGFKIDDVKVILSSHVHFDHAGGISELQRMSGAKVIASDLAAEVLRSGRPSRSDPQFGVLQPYAGSSNVEELGSRKHIDLGSLHLSVMPTPGHTPGGTSWAWQSCEEGRCLNIVYADSLSAVADDSFRYTGDERYSNAASDMSRSIEAIGGAPCDILITVHPEFANLWSVVNELGKGNRTQLIDPSACRRYADVARARLERRLESERK